MIFSLAAHGTALGIILITGAGFRNAPPPSDLQILNFIPPNILDRAGSGGGTPIVNPAAVPKPRAAAPVEPRPQPREVHTEEVERAPAPTPHQTKEPRHPIPDETDEAGVEKAPKPSRHTRRHVEVSYAPAGASKSTKTKRPVKTEQSEESSESNSRAEARRLRQIQNSLDDLASGVRTSGSPNSIVDVVGIGGGEAFSGYRDVVFSYYYHAWITPDSLASRSASAEARVTVARSGEIISAELVRPSDDSALDRSVEQALRRVSKLPPFPASSHDAQRTFNLRFSPEAKEMAG
ncbi:MAG TPA: TonB family protein [Verrucomicrobiae bacterium]